jgi:hypothetical protein
MKPIWLLPLAALGLSWTATSSLSHERRAPLPAASSNFRLCQGAAESALGVEVVPERVDQTTAGEQLSLRLRFTSKFDKRASVRHSTELVSDSGKVVRQAEISPIRTLKGRGDDHHEAFVTPAGLADGFYQLRVNAVGSDGQDDAAEVVETYLRVEGGRIRQLSSDEWFGQSAANQGVRL